MRRILAYKEWYRPRQRPVFLSMGTSTGYYEADGTAIGKYNKTRVREIAAERGFMKASVKKDSLGVCFCPMDYRSFLGKM